MNIGQKSATITTATIITVALLGTGGMWWYTTHKSGTSPAGAVQSASNRPLLHTPQPAISTFNKTQYSLTDPTSIWVIANKQHPLSPISYIPPDLTVPNVTLSAPGADNMKMRAATAIAVEQLFAAAKQAGLNLTVISGYRSYTYQQTVYGGYVSKSGQTTADQESARAGYSEHQTGLALDIGAANSSCTLEACFGTTPEGQWLAANAYQYGFILRYPTDKVAVTGYEYEPWHFRYVGTDLSQEMHKHSVETLEEFFGIAGGATYK